MRRHKQLAQLALTYVLLLSGCNSQKGHDSTEGTVPLPVTINQVQAALDQKNFGDAVALSSQLTAASPHDRDAWLTAADANAAAGNRLQALAAIEKSLSNGMRDPTRLDNDGYLDGLRSSTEYQTLLRRYGLQKAIAQAGDTSIDETSAGTVVHAGDLSVTLSNSK
jgi:Flp pilus assembly protein TadD